jgi:repressor LexA
MARSLTAAQEKTFSFLQHYIATHGEPPTVTELAKAFELRSLRSAGQRIESLERKGLITRSKFKHRNIKLIAQAVGSEGLVRIPVIASAGCDAMEVYAQDEFDEFVLVDKRFIGAHTSVAAIRAVGDSMQDAGIRNGDYVIVEVTQAVETGDRVVAIIGNMAVIKQYKEIAGVVYLNPENSSGGYYPIVVRQEDSKIFGKVLSVIPGNEWVDDIKIEYYPGYDGPR